MYDVVQIPDDNTHDAALNVPPALLSIHDMVPVGVVGELEVSLTVTVSVTDEPEFTTGEFNDTVTAVGSRVLETDVPLLLLNIILLLPAIAGITVKPLRSGKPKMQDIIKSGFIDFRIFGLRYTLHFSGSMRLFFSYICSLRMFLR